MNMIVGDTFAVAGHTWELTVDNESMPYPVYSLWLNYNGKPIGYAMSLGVLKAIKPHELSQILFYYMVCCGQDSLTNSNS